jgi:cytochrome c-type biogenesis protein CcmE
MAAQQAAQGQDADRSPAARFGAEAMAMPLGRSPWPWKFAAGGAIILVALAYLVYASLGSATVYYLTVREVQAKGPAAHGGQPLRVSGTVVPGSIAREGHQLRFAVADGSDSAARLSVVYAGIVPDIFAEQIDVVVEGRYGGDEVFRATSLLTKCPSRFESGPA